MIGEGGFGSVYLCSSLKMDGSNLFAVKCIKSSKSEISAKKEQQFGYMSRLNSPYLVKYCETFTLNNDCFVVMEYFENGTLHELINKYRKEKQKIPQYVCFTLIRMFFFSKDCRKNSYIIITRSICTSL
jgi:serine/threonine protein kinase